MADVNDFFIFMIHGLDQFLFGSVAITVLLILAGVFLLATYFNANKFTAFAFVGCALLACGLYGYSFFGWIAPLGALLLGLMLGIAFIRVFSL